MKKGKIKELLQELLEKLKDASHEVLDWFEDEVEPELLEFIKANKDIIIRAIMDTAKHYAAEPGHIKFKNATERLGNEFKDELGNVTITDSWLGFAIQFVFMILKSQGKIPS